MTITNKTGVSFTAKEVASIAEIEREDVLRMDPEILSDASGGRG